MLNGGLWRVRFSVTRKLLILERETGFEPATSSLGIQTYIGSKSLARFCCEFLNLQRLAESAFSRIDRLNEAQTRHVPSNKEPTATVGRVWNRCKARKTHRIPAGYSNHIRRCPAQTNSRQIHEKRH
jgi:hypothetical protein